MTNSSVTVYFLSAPSRTLWDVMWRQSLRVGWSLAEKQTGHFSSVGVGQFTLWQWSWQCRDHFDKLATFDKLNFCVQASKLTTNWKQTMFVCTAGEFIRWHLSPDRCSKNSVQMEMVPSEETQFVPKEVRLIQNHV